MRFIPTTLLRCCAVVTLTAVCSATQTSTAPNYAAERAANAKALTQSYGWFSLIGLESIKAGTTTVGSAKDNTVMVGAAPAHLMTLTAKDGVVTVTDSAPCLRYQGKPVSNGFVFSADESAEAGLTCNTLRFWAIDRGHQRYLRIKDSNAPALQHFHGLNWYAPDAHFRVNARWVLYTTPHTMNVMNKLGQVTPVPAPGYVEFELDGKSYKLTPMSADKDSLFFVFRDETYRQTTDGGGRFLYTAGPSNGIHQAGTVVLDFNLAENPPCAYSPYATCPLAPPENRLPVPITAGEKRYQD
jgi:uncharacterized protein (DUF1684 family)